MKKIFLFLVLALIPVYFLTISGCESTSSAPDGSGVIKGTIKDSVNTLGIAGVTVTTVPATSTVVTDTSGNFTISGVNDGTYTLTFKKSGYFTRTGTATINRDTAIVKLAMLFTNVYTFNNRVLSEYFNPSSLSAINLYLGDVINETGTQYDMQLRDSAGTSANYFLRSGDLALRLAGFQTKFSEALFSGRTFTKAEFDTLSKYYTVDGLINPSRDFTEDRIPSFNASPNMQNNVFAFWLKGRNLATPTYGMFYMNYSFIDTVGQDQLKLIIDVKINRGGLNLFNGNNN